MAASLVYLWQRQSAARSAVTLLVPVTSKRSGAIQEDRPASLYHLARRDSNPELPDPESGVLPVAPRATNASRRYCRAIES